MLSPTELLIASALTADDPHALLRQAQAMATTAHMRQQVAIATAYVDGNADLVAVLAREHLVERPESVLVAWMAASARQRNTDRKDQS